jgi:hypothetical protein
MVLQIWPASLLGVGFVGYSSRSALLNPVFGSGNTLREAGILRKPAMHPTTLSVMRFTRHTAQGRSMQWPGTPIIAEAGRTPGPIGGNRVWTVNVGNNGPGAGLGTANTGFTVQQTSGTACNPTVVTQFIETVPGGSRPTIAPSLIHIHGSNESRSAP